MRFFPLNLDAWKQIKIPNAIQVQKRGATTRLPRPSEALALALGALGTLNRSSGVKTLNAEIDGQPVALAVIEGAQSGEDDEGNTTLTGVEDGSQHIEANA